jgi:hypothetical protein
VDRRVASAESTHHNMSKGMFAEAAEVTREFGLSFAGNGIPVAVYDMY